MEKIVNPDGSIRLGIFDSPVNEINGHDHLLWIASGRTVSAFVKRLLYKGLYFIGITTPGIMAGIAVVDNALVVAAAFTQCIGRFHGRLRTRDNEVIPIDGIPGWTEDHFARW